MLIRLTLSVEFLHSGLTGRSLQSVSVEAAGQAVQFAADKISLYLD